MSAQLLACPLCSQPGFSSLGALRDGLIEATTRQLICPICRDVLLGLDKFTIHLFSHCIQNNTKMNSSENRISDQNASNLINIQETNEPLNFHDQSVSSLVTNLYCSTARNQAFQHIDSNLINNSTITRTQCNVSTIADDVVCTSKKSGSLDDRVTLNNSAVGANEKESALIQEKLPESREPFPTKDNSFLHTEQIIESCGLIQTKSGLQTNPQTSEETRCNLCGISFNDSNVLQMHKQLVHNHFNDSNVSNSSERKGFGCFLCSKVFKMRGSLMVHLRVVHGGSNVGNSLILNSTPDLERSVVCNTCGKSFTKEQQLTQHLKTHEEKQWACDVCQKLFTTKYFLKKHKRLHTGEMPYSCSICHKSFTFQQSMHKHALYHSNDKPHSCPDCHRSFKELSTLTNHRRIHTGEKPFCCETCGKCFRQRVSYLVHRRIHTGAMPYQCTACGKSFRYKVSERTHKCPSQPPGTIVRQAGELLQKLQERVQALHREGVDTQQFAPRQQRTQVLAGAGGGRDGPARLRPFDPLAAIEVQASTQRPFQSGQFVIILDDTLQAVRSVVTRSPVVDPSLGVPPTPPASDDRLWCRRSCASSQERGEDSGRDRPSALSKIRQWSDEHGSRDEEGRIDNPGEKGELFGSSHKCKKSELKSLDLDLSETSDFFSVLENLHSPSERLRNLTISPSIQNPERNTDCHRFPFESASCFAQTDSGDKSLTLENNVNPLLCNKSQEVLQTINEESLKQLLYGAPSDSA